MTTAPPNPTVVSNLLSTHRALVDTLTSFLTVATHHVLFLRRIYPPVSFLATRAYNYPVRQNRHPAVCAWITDAIAAVRDQFEKNTVEQVSICIYECDSNRVLERWTFDLRSFPSVAKRDRDVPFETTKDPNDEDTDSLSQKLNIADLEANFRATLSRISTSSSKLKPLPEGEGAPECSFTLTIEVKDNADRPVGRLEREERKWMAAEPEPFLSFDTTTTTVATSINIPDDPTSFNTNTTNKPQNGISNKQQQGKTHPIRRLEAGELRMEVWVEESAAKFEYKTPSQRTPEVRAAEMSFGAGTEKFNPVHGYDDVEGNDLNRKPGGGSNQDYQRY